MAGSQDDVPPTFTYVNGAVLPQVVVEVMKDIQSFMMDDAGGRHGRPQEIPNMPKEFICSKVTDKKNEVLAVAGENEDPSKSPECYEIIIPFLMTKNFDSIFPSPRSTHPSWFRWSGNVVSFDKVSSTASPDLVMITIRAVIANVKDVSSGERQPTLFQISTDPNDIPSRPLRKFLRSPLVHKQESGLCVVSSHKMTITWLRSRLNKALNKYRDVEKNIEVIATIKQKEGGPLILSLHVERKRRHARKIKTYDFLFTICPAFRLTRCQLVIPVYSKIDTMSPDLDSFGKQFLWKTIVVCDETHEHKTVKLASSMGAITSQTKLPSVSGMSGEAERLGVNQKNDDKMSIDKARPMSPSQRRQCEQCSNPASRMLLEYYFQYGHIPDDEMNQAVSFVWEILTFLKVNIENDLKPNDPKILEFVESGSVSEKLKVVQPDEFDVMIAIDLPQSTRCYTFIEDKSFPTGYAICQARRSKSFSRGLKRCFKHSDEFSHCLAPEQLAFGWLYGKLEQAINKYKKASPKADLKLRQSGPALLLEITPSDPSMPALPAKISVDLVLALKLGENDSRYAVAKRAKEEQFYKKVVREPSGGEDSRNVSEYQRGDVARKNLKYLWRISYSSQERRYLEYVREIQKINGVEGCQDICLKILKTVCTREVLKREESVICHKLSSYILKTALFHVLANTDLVKDWTMDSLADRYVDLLDRLSTWEDLPHFFFNNASSLRKVFPHDAWCESEVGKNLFDDLHGTLKIQLLNRFLQIADSFKKCKSIMDERSLKLSNQSSNYSVFLLRQLLRRFFQILNYFIDCKNPYYTTLLADVLSRRTPEEVIHPPFGRYVQNDEESKKSLVKAEAVDRKVSKAAKTERKSGPRSDAQRNLQRAEEEEQRSRAIQRERAASRRPSNLLELLRQFRGQNVIPERYSFD